MQRNIPEGTEPIYDFTTPVFKGIAEDGPRVGEFLASTSLTYFIAKPYKSQPHLWPATPEEQDAARQEWQNELNYNRAHPDRYDYDLDRKVWVWVDY